MPKKLYWLAFSKKRLQRFALRKKVKSAAKRHSYDLRKGLSVTDVTWNLDDESPIVSVTGQPRGDCPYLYKFWIL
jgi:hypothetical protein